MIDIPIKVREALHDGTYLKNYRFLIIKDDGSIEFTIDNNSLVCESVKFNERMCSDDTLKFGLCEGTNLEFQYFGLPNITGRRIQAFIDCQYGDNEWYSIPMGFFDVKECSRQASTGIIKASCYNKLLSDYLDAKANDLLKSNFDNPNTPILVVDIKNILLNDYEIKSEPETYKEFGVSVLPSATVIFNTAYKYSNLQAWSPMNAYNAGVKATSETRYIALDSTIYTASFSDNSVVRFHDIHPNLEWLNTFEEDVYNYLVELLSEAGTNLTQQAISDLLISGNNTTQFKGMTAISYARVIYKNGKSEYYSTFGYKHNVNGISGSYVDLFNKSLIDVSFVEFYIPRSLGCSKSATSFSAGNPMKCWYGAISPSDYFEFYGDASAEQIGASTRYYKCSDSVGYFKDDEARGISWTKDRINAFYADNYSDLDKIEIVPSSMPEFTLRDITSALYEVYAQFGRLDRQTDLFSGITLNNSRLLPADNLYPSDELYPMSQAESAQKAMYSQLWADEGNVHRFKYLIITYKGLNDEGNEVDKTLQRTINEHGTDNYNMSDNWLFRNLVWTAEQVGEYADTMVELMRDITWFPFEMWCAGLPYVEAGDEIEISVNGNAYTSYVLNRTLNGIQNLQDTFINGTLNIF